LLKKLNINEDLIIVFKFRPDDAEPSLRRATGVTLKAIKFVGLTLSAGLFLVSCSNSDFAGSTQNSTNRDCKKNPKLCDGSGGGGTAVDGDTSQRDIQKNSAVLAVRDMSCAFCHAQIASNVISDFSISSDETGAEQTFRKIMYQVNHEMGAKGQPTIVGEFIVPKVEFPMIDRTSECVFSSEASAQASPKQKRSLIDYLVKCVQPVFAWGAESQKFIAKDTVTINPVSSAQDIIGIVGSSKLSGSGMALVGESRLSGISGSRQTGFTAAASITCDGAAVFDGPLVLKDTTISTEKGCRIYSTASIFVFGSTMVTTTSDKANLQLMSPLFVGFDISAGNAEGRLKHENNAKLKLSRGSTAEVASMIVADATKLGITSYGGNSNFGYSRVVAAAPVIYSRHNGPFSGAIIAEHFIGKIGALSFTFDPVFNAGKTNVFPEIKRALVVSR
jgi:hypothetical protein